ncbi:MAG: nucleotidyltransferase family protein [Clostridia bacterium]|nr:nucleotidyltransferase family protein [Clostridia bacterium]
MNDTGRAVCALINRSIFGGAPGAQPFFPGAQSPLWPSVLDELTAHRIHSLPERLVTPETVADGELRAKWLRLCEDDRIKVLRVMAMQQRVVRMFSEADIPFVVIKGSAASVYYPQPFMRAMGDIDLLVKQADLDRAAKLLEDGGFSPYESEEAVSHHLSFIRDGVEVELHRRIGGVSPDNTALLALFERGIDERVNARLGSFSFPMLPPMLNGLCLLIHINQHLRVGIGLRQIVDWMMFASSELDQETFSKSFRPLAASLGMERFAVAVTAMCKKYLGLGSCFDTSSADETVVDELAEYIMNKGNFGHKTGSRGRVASAALRGASNPFGLIKLLQKGGLSRWKAAKKHPILRPFAWIYQLRCSMRELKKNRVSSKEMRLLRRDGLRQRRLIEELGLDIDNKLHSPPEGE